MTPIRMQLKRSAGFNLQNASLAANGLPCVKVDRTTKWGNPFTVEECGSAEEAVDHFEHDIMKASVFHPEDYEAHLAPLRGKNLACWCRLDARCHADVLLELANRLLCEETSCPSAT